MKILVLQNKLSFIPKGFDETIAFFKRNGLDVSFEFKNTAIPFLACAYQTRPGFDSRTGKQTTISLIGPDESVRAQILKVGDLSQYFAVVFLWDYQGVPMKSTETVSSRAMVPSLTPTTQYIQVAMSSFTNDRGDLWKTLSHEMMHTFFYALAKKEIFLNDPMDSWKAPNDYVENDNPGSPTGNYSEAFRRLAPYLTQLEPMPGVVITRSADDGTETQGSLSAAVAGATFSCRTLELPWRQNARGVSCIPKGTYRVRFTRSLKFPIGSYEVQDVPGRSGIRIHIGNYAFKKNGLPDIEGCILLGESYADLNGDRVLDIANSTKAIRAFEGFMARKDFTLTIK